jgi:hypothetical protein
MIGIAGCAPNTMVATGSTQGVVTAVPSGTADPRVLAAVHTYEAFNRTLVEAQRHPVQPGRAYSSEADFSRYSFDPLRAEHESAISELSLARREYRGRPPTSQIIVTEIDLGAQIGPTVVLSDCRNGQKKWQEYEAASNKMVPADDEAVTAHGLTVRVIFYHQRWGVQTIEPDPSRACKG